MLYHFIVLLCLCHVVNCEYLELPEGSSCTWRGVTGLCVSVFRCLGAIEDIENKDNPPICTYEGSTPIICCTDCQLVNDTRLMLMDPNRGILYKTGSNKAKDKCLEYIHTVSYPCKEGMRVTIGKQLDKERNCYQNFSIHEAFAVAAAGGRNAYREEFPHMALLGYGESMDTADWLCGGSVISEKYILTAAHCVSTPSLGSIKYVALGILKRTDPPKLWQRYNVKRIIPHPEYKPPSKYNDIALLETTEEISFSGNIRPACLHTDEEYDDIAQATGWGALGHRKSLANTLQSVDLTSFSEEECSGYYPPHRHLRNGYDHRTQMCYGDRDAPKDTCEGDSGGPLQSQSHEECVYTILGVTSYGRQCGISGGSGMYTRVSHYVRWIEDIVWP